MGRLRCIAAFALVAAAGACRGGKVTLGISDSTFVQTVAQLHAINADTSLDRAARAARRAAVLRAHGLTADSLERAARAMAAHPQHAMDVWTAIQQHMRSQRDTAPRNGAARRGA